MKGWKRYMCNNDNHDNGNCVAEILNVIFILQQNACPDSCTDSCDRPMLGGGTSCLVCNTRPIQLFTCCGNGTPFSMPICKDLVETCSNPDGVSGSNNCSSVFRVEKIEGNCCTYRVLAPNTDTSCCSTMPWIASNSFFTMNLDCTCAIRCLSDCYVECV